MIWKVLVASSALFVLDANGAALWQGPPQTSPAFRAGVEMVVLQVSVTGRGRRYVADLQAEDFTVLEDGRPQPLVFFSRSSPRGHSACEEAMPN